MTNEIIGILGAFGLTLLLFFLRHLILPSNLPSGLPSGRCNKRRYVTPMTHREKHLLNKNTTDDDAWLLWAPELDSENRVDRGPSHEPHAERRKVRLYDEHRDDTTIGGEIR